MRNIGKTGLSPVRNPCPCLYAPVQQPPLPLTLTLVRASALCMSFMDMLLIRSPCPRHHLQLECTGSSERPGSSHGNAKTSYGHSYAWFPFVPSSCSVTYSVSSVSGAWPHCCHQLNSIGHQHPRNTCNQEVQTEGRMGLPVLWQLKSDGAGSGFQCVPFWPESFCRRVPFENWKWTNPYKKQAWPISGNTRMQGSYLTEKESRVKE